MRNPSFPVAYVWEQPSAVSVSELQNVSSSSFYSEVERRWRATEDQLYEYNAYGDDWDGMGSRAISKAAYGAAIKYLKRARQCLGMAAPNSAVLTPEGLVRLEWWENEDVQQAEFGNAGQIEWMQYGPKLKPQHWREQFEGSGQSRGDTWDSATTQDLGTYADSAALT